MGGEYQCESLKKQWELCFRGLHLESLLPWSPFTYHWSGIGPNPCLIPSFFPPSRVIITFSCQLDTIQTNPSSKCSQVNMGRDSSWGSVWIMGACWWRIILIMVIEVGRFSHYGCYHSLGKGILSCMNGEGAEHKRACVNPLLCSDCGYNVTSCFQLCHDACNMEF